MRRLLALLVLLSAPAWAATEDRRPESPTVTSSDNSCSTANAHTTLDDDVDSPTADWCTATTCGGTGTSSPVWHLNFPTPTGNPTTGASEQTFAARVRQCSTGGTNGTCRLDLFCNGVLVASGSEQNVTNTTGQTITQTWTMNTGSCAANGSDVQVQLVCTSAGGSPSSRRTSDADAVEWRVNYSVAGATYHAIVIGE